VDPHVRRITELERENAKLTHKLKQAELIIDVQKKVADLLKGSNEETS
jgi:cell shape-determining protein MreC